MFGRVRASSSSLHSLDRPPSKLFKDDALSIYETTLMKLRLGSQRDLGPSSEEDMESQNGDSNATATATCLELPTSSSSINFSESFQHLATSPDAEAMEIDTDSSSFTGLLSNSIYPSQSTTDFKRPQSRNVSLLYLFSKYNSSKHVLASSDRELRSVVSHSGSATTSPCSSNSQSFGSPKELCPALSSSSDFLV